MKKIGKLTIASLLAVLGVTTMASCGEDSVAKAAVGKVIINQDGEHVVEDFDLPKTVKNGEETFDLKWTSSDTSVLNIVDGNTADVKRPFDKNVAVTLTATVETEGGKASTSFKTTVDAIPYEEAVKASIGISNGYNTKKVDVNLPASSNQFKDEIKFTYSLVGTPTTVKLEGTKLTIDPTSETKEIAKLKVNAVSSITKEIEVDVKVNSYTTVEAYDAAEAGALVTVKGIIVARETYSANYKNTTLYLQDVSGKGGYDAYRLKCESKDAYDKDLAIGNVILVTGKKKIYNGLREFNDGSTYEVASTGKTPKDTDITNIIKTDASQVNKDYQCQIVHFNELTVVEVDKKDSKGRWNITVGDATDKKKQFVVRIDTYLLPTSSEAYKAIDALKVAAGDVISAKGVCGWNNNAQLLPTAKDSITIVTKGTSTPAPEQPAVTVEMTVDKTITFDDKATKRTEYDANHQIWVENGITVRNDKTAASNDVIDKENPVRFYANSDLTISAEQNIRALEFTYDGTYLPAETFTLEGCTVQVDTTAKKCRILLNTPAKSLKIANLPSQWRVVSIGVDFAE